MKDELLDRYPVPVVSVIVTALNAEAHLSEAVESILAQTMTAFELFIVDDGSTDQTRRIIEEYAVRDPRIIPIINAKNLGQPLSRNSAMQRAHGEFVAIMDADDVALPKRLSVQVNYLRKNQEIGIVSGLVSTIDENGNSLREIRGMLGKGAEIFWRELTGRSSSMVHPTVMFRRSLVEKFNLYYDPKVPYAQDKELWSRMLLHTDAVVLPRVLVKYRVHPDSISKSKNQLQRQYARQAQRQMIHTLLPKENVELDVDVDLFNDFSECAMAMKDQLLMALDRHGRFSQRAVRRLRADCAMRCFRQGSWKRWSVCEIFYKGKGSFFGCLEAVASMGLRKFYRMVLAGGVIMGIVR